MTVHRARPARGLIRCAIVLLTVLSTTACVVIFRGVKAQRVEKGAPPTTIFSPLEVHLFDGTTILYPAGVQVSTDSIRGSGTAYDLTGNARAAASAISLDSVAAMESFKPATNAGATAAVTVLASAATTAGAALLAVAIFGSCPTVYSDSGGHPILEAETFSYSLAPLFEQRDVDRLEAGADSNGELTLEVRNEALETHYINHLQLLEASHAPDEVVLPDAANHLLAVSHIVQPSRIMDRAGHDLRRLATSATASEPFRTEPKTLAHAGVDHLDDYIAIDVPAPPGADSLALVFDMRNSLLNTVLLYDMMLGQQGARAIDWLGEDMASIGPVVQMGRWYTSRWECTYLCCAPDATSRWAACPTRARSRGVVSPRWCPWRATQCTCGSPSSPTSGESGTSR